MSYEILVADRLSDEGVDLLREKFNVTVQTGMTEDQLVEAAPKYHAILVRSATKITRRIIEAATNLKIIARAGVGVDNIDVPCATHHGIFVVNSPTGNTLAAAEHTVAHMFALSRGIPGADRSMREGKWDRKTYIGTQITGKTLGLIGFGKIGSAVGKRAIGVGMNVLVFDPITTEDQVRKLGARLVSMEELFAESDFISLHVPKSERTYHMISTAQFARMKDGVRIINCARGGVIDENALVDAIESGKVAGAALDVFEKEPLDTGSRLFGHPNIFLTPHLGASTLEAQVTVAIDVAQQVKLFFEGQFPTTAVNMPAIKPEILESHKPYFDLAEKMGILHAGILDDSVFSINVTYTGALIEMETSLITRHFLVGLLRSRYSDINLVNAPDMLKESGVSLTETMSGTRSRYHDQITTQVVNRKSTHIVTGTLTAADGPRIVNIDGYSFDFSPHGRIMLATHRDMPGIIGKVGTLLGDRDINIAAMQVGRESVRGRAIMSISIDDDLSAEVQNAILGFPGVETVSVIMFDESAQTAD